MSNLYSRWRLGARRSTGDGRGNFYRVTAFGSSDWAIRIKNVPGLGFKFVESLIEGTCQGSSTAFPKGRVFFTQQNLKMWLTDAQSMSFTLLIPSLNANLQKLVVCYPLLDFYLCYLFFHLLHRLLILGRHIILRRRITSNRKRI